MQFSQRLDDTEARFEALTRQMADPAVIGDSDTYRKTAKARSELEEIVNKYRDYKQAKHNYDEGQQMLQDPDPELRQMATDEVNRLGPELTRIEEELKVLLLPKDPLDEKNVVIEIRAGTGGDEATLFAAEIFRMYSRYAETQSWRVEVTSVSESPVGGLKEVIALVSGDKVYSRMKYESGVHRVQRVPQTEQQGRVHTSAITVAVLPEADEVEIKIDRQGHPHRHVLFLRSRRTIGEHYILSGSNHPSAHRPDRFLPGREIADQESRQSRPRVALAIVRN